MKSYRSLAVGVGLELLLGGALPLRAETNLLSANTDCINRFWSAMDNPTHRVTVLSFGDSMSESYDISAQYFLFQDLKNDWGLSGVTFQNVFNAALLELGGGATVVGPNSTWWTAHVRLPPAAYAYWRNAADTPTQSVLSDSVGVFWIAHPSGGPFTLSASTNGGPWGVLLQLNGFSAQLKGCYTNVVMARNKHRLRVDGVSGTNLILGPRYLDTEAGGVDIAFMAQGGANLNQIFSLATNVLYPIVAAIDPHLVVVHMKEVGDIGTVGLSNRLYDLEALWQHSVPRGDVVYIGTPFEEADLSTNRTESQNLLVRAAAVRDQRCYVDCMTPLVSYPSMLSQGYLRDHVHLSASGSRVVADVLRDDLGLYALRLNRELRATQSAAGIVLDWETRQGVVFELQSSSNLLDWETRETTLGSGSRVSSTNDPAEQGEFYRVRLDEN